MNADAAFLAAVLDRWGDSLTRLVYADWLDEQGDELSQWKAQFLRVWCALVEIPLTELEAFTGATEELEKFIADLPPEWTAYLDSCRFHLVDDESVRVRAVAYSQYESSIPSTFRIESVSEENENEWHVTYSYRAGRNVPGDGSTLRVQSRLFVERKTGRVHMIGSSGKCFLTHPPYPDPPGACADG